MVGGIVLFVKAGPISQQVLFSMVEDLGPYNAIVGRTWLHSMKSISSTYCQTISYLTTSGQVDLQGSQLVARQCYQLSIREREKGKGRDSSPLIIAIKACRPGHFRRQGKIGSRAPGIHAHRRPE